LHIETRTFRNRATPIEQELQLINYSEAIVEWEEWTVEDFDTGKDHDIN